MKFGQVLKFWALREFAVGNLGTRRTKTSRTGIAVLLAAALLSACTSLVPAPLPNTYDITAPATFPGLKAGTRAQVLILEPAAVKVLDSQDIVIKPSDEVVEYLGKSQWSDRLPKLIQARLIESFENTGKARAVAKPGDGLVIDYQIVSSIREFQANLEGSNEAAVSISVKLVSDRSGKVVRSEIFTANVPLSSTEPLAVVSALNRAFAQVARDIVQWTLRAV